MTGLGARIRSMRKAKGLSMRGLAERSGVSHPYISQIENGRNNVSAAIIRRLAYGLNCTEYTEYAELMGYAGHEPDNRDKLIEELVSLNLWIARRLPSVHKEFAYGLLDELTNHKHERL